MGMSLSKHEMEIRANLQQKFGKGKYRLKHDGRGYSLYVLVNGHYQMYAYDFNSWYKKEFNADELMKVRN